MLQLGNDWDARLQPELEQRYMADLLAFLQQEYATQIVYPAKQDLFACLKHTSYQGTKVVILGQDPYHGERQAHGLCFSVQGFTPFPPSLKNIFKEIATDCNKPLPSSGDLSRWAQQGVLLLNTVLTVRHGSPNSHQGKGWEQFTDAIIRLLNQHEDPIVFLLWGANARAKASFITNPNHLVLQSVHPSPLSAYGGFFGCKHFSQANAFLSKHNRGEIDW